MKANFFLPLLGESGGVGEGERGRVGKLPILNSQLSTLNSQLTSIEAELADSAATVGGRRD
ncbi:MAG: hypothetical protein ACRC62_10525 [Microcoleus sp.]